VAVGVPTRAAPEFALMFWALVSRRENGPGDLLALKA